MIRPEGLYTWIFINKKERPENAERSIYSKLELFFSKTLLL
jgi:hypothetical protein